MDLHSTIKEAIETSKRIQFTYQGNTDAEPSQRTVDPWIYGERNGKPALYGYQLEGGSGEGQRRFNLGKVEDLRITDVPMKELPPKSADVTKWDSIHASR
jgi:predicted DNA-binding transcriptional regulator YafY